MVTYPKIRPTVLEGYPKVTGVTTGPAVKKTAASEGAWPKVQVVDEEGFPKVLLATLQDQAIARLNGFEPVHYWDFTTDRAIFSDTDVGGVADTPNWSFTRATVGTAETAAGAIVEFASGELRRTDKGVLLEGARTNLFLNSAVGATQDIVVTAVAHTLSFRGTGTITLTGASTDGPLVGTGANDRVTLTFTPAAATLTLTVSGSCTNVQLEIGAFASSWIPTAGASVARAADILRISGVTLAYPFSFWSEYHRIVDTGTTEIIIQANSASGNTECSALRVVAADIADALTTNLTGLNQAFAGSAATVAVPSIVKIAGRFASNSVNVALDGVSATEDISVDLPADPTFINIGVRANDLIQPFNYIRRLAVLPSALSNTDLQTITT